LQQPLLAASGEKNRETSEQMKQYNNNFYTLHSEWHSRYFLLVFLCECIPVVNLMLDKARGWVGEYGGSEVMYCFILLN
jgi:hypothetical protein